MRKLLVACVLVAMALSLLSLFALSGPISATSASAISVTSIMCKKFNAVDGDPNIKLAKCSDPAATGGSGTLPDKDKADKITWAVSGSFTKISAPTGAASTEGTCPVGTIQEDEDQATVLKSGGAAATAIPKGWAFTAYVCITSSGTATEASGAPATFAPAG